MAHLVTCTSKNICQSTISKETLCLRLMSRPKLLLADASGSVGVRGADLLVVPPPSAPHLGVTDPLDVGNRPLVQMPGLVAAGRRLVAAACV